MRDINEAIKKEGLRRGYSLRTIQTYQEAVRRFFEFCGKETGKVSKTDLKGFLYHLEEKGKTGSTLNVYLNALKFFFEDVMRRKMNVDMKYSRIPKKLPEVLTKEEVKKLIYAVRNNKHKIMISLLYASGLRASELINLKIKDLNFRENYGFVRNGKGRKDRMFIIPEKLKIVLMQMSVSRNKEENLFLTNRNKKYDVRSLQQIVKKAAKLAGLDYKEIHCHTLRHSFATHLIEENHSIEEVQHLLGIKALKLL
ncbi:tyrosine-type recombinase/integrase [Candidatus Pacearchaeota archaeon]|nr:tyrosine-type recombinase/integrase [Candidatus Pacearchaeota archaeon]